MTWTRITQVWVLTDLVQFGFVVASDQVCSEEYLAIDSMAGTNFSHGFNVYSHVFGVYPRVQQLSQDMPVTIGHYTKCPFLTNIAPCMRVLWHQMSIPNK